MVANTRPVLELLDVANVRATFFVLSEIAERQRGLLQKIFAGGHEIAAHGYWHELAYRQMPEQCADDVGRSIRAVTHACPGAAICGYRVSASATLRAGSRAGDVARR